MQMSYFEEATTLINISFPPGQHTGMNLKNKCDFDVKLSVSKLVQMH